MPTRDRAKQILACQNVTTQSLIDQKHGTNRYESRNLKEPIGTWLEAL
jgi:hypothetical protein